MINMTEKVKQTREALNLAHHVAIIVIFFACLVCPLEGRICTRVRSEQQVRTVKYPGECQQSFEASCGWFSMKTCVFNEVPCMKERNMTVALYRIVEDCCPGYIRNRAGHCVSMSELEVANSSVTVTEEQTSTLPTVSEPSLSDLVTEGVNVTEDVGQGVTEGRNLTLGRNVTVGVNATDEDKGGKAAAPAKDDDDDDKDAVDSSKEEKKEEVYPYSDTEVKDTVTSIAVDPEAGGSASGSRSDDDDDDGFFLGISHGAYAGIICGILFVACVALLTAVHYRKRRLQEEKKATVSADQEAAQRQQMIPMEKIDSPPTVTT